MAHFVYAMQASSKPPAGDGTTQGWFRYYKWDIDGEAFVPVSGCARRGPERRRHHMVSNGQQYPGLCSGSEGV
jgi:hypothetical protein